MTELEHSLIALLEAFEKAQVAQDLELKQLAKELKAREEEATALRLSLEQLHGLLETSLNLQKGLTARLKALEGRLRSE